MTSEEGFFHWLAGFIDGEGSFNIAMLGEKDRPHPRYVCRFELHLRSDDYRILVEIKERTGIGRLTPIRARQRTDGSIDRPLLAWRVDTKDGCVRFVKLLDAHPLRAKKSADFEIWRRAVAIWNTAIKHGVPADYTEMAALRAALHELRVYRSEHEEAVEELIKIQRGLSSPIRRRVSSAEIGL